MKTCIFTIVSNNYLHYANTLFESVREHAPEVELCLGLCDKQTPDTHCHGAQIVQLSDLDIPSLGQFIYQYSILELNTAMKPYLIEHLMDQGYDKVIYMDPDIKVFEPLTGMLDLLDKHNILLTPHLTDLLDDGCLPNELGILQAGSYNLGYIGLNANEETRKLVKWWQRKLYKECVVDISRGLFVDQKWMDMVPSIFDGVYINRDEGWNVAYWNLNHRDVIEVEKGRFEVNGRPLVFFHYSGYSIEAETLSKHQNRFLKTSKGPSLVSLCDIYNDRLISNGIKRFKGLEYHYSRFADAVLVPDSARLLIKDDVFFSDIDFFSADDCPRIHKYLNSPAEKSSKGGVLISKLAEAIWKSRPDLQAAFPDLYRGDALKFAHWVLEAGGRECGLDEVYLEPIAKSLNRCESHNSLRDTKAGSSLFRMVWAGRKLVPVSLKKALGAGVKDYIISRAFPYTNQVSSGINLIGYLQAESGVGEAARSSLRALKAGDLPYTLMDYRVGNVSRMNEIVAEKYNDSSAHPINLVHVNADQSQVVRESLGEEAFSQRYNIGYWYWEMPEFPEAFDFAFEQVDEVWVSSTYNQTAISQRTNKPVCLIPPNVNVEVDSNIGRDSFSLDDEDFIFFHMSDVLSIPERKNPLAVVRAFEKAFSKDSEAKVKLVLKISNLDYQEDLKAQILEIANRDPRIIFLDGYLEREELNNLLNNIDCYVSLHRAEGFGLPIAEAMSLGKVVIATHWSGNTDFMNDRNSLPVSYELINLAEDIGPYEKGQVWADPDIDDAADKMFCISLDQKLYGKISKEAESTIRAQYSPSVSSKKMQSRVAEINQFI